MTAVACVVERSSNSETNEARLSAVEWVFSKKARVGQNGGLSKIGGPHIFSVSG